MSSNHCAADFFDLDFQEAIEQFIWIQPYLVEVARELSLVDWFQDLTVEIVFANTTAYFHLLEGSRFAGKTPEIKLPYPIFRQLLLTNFGRWLTVETFVEQICSEYSNSDVFAPHTLNKLETLCEIWYKIHYLAAERFFSLDENLRRYFHSSKFMMLWQNEVTASKHDFYLASLCQKILTQNKTILDVGSGFGRLQPIYTGAKEVINVDISKPMLSKAEELSQLSKVEYYQADINNLPFDQFQFDIIIALQILMHVSNPFKTLKYLSRFLIEGGEIWIDFTCDRRLRGEFCYQESFFTRIYSREYVANYCNEIGFSIGEILEIPDRHDHYWLVLQLMKN